MLLPLLRALQQNHRVLLCIMTPAMPAQTVLATGDSTLR